MIEEIKVSFAITEVHCPDVSVNGVFMMQDFTMAYNEVFINRGFMLKSHHFLKIIE